MIPTPTTTWGVRPAAPIAADDAAAVTQDLPTGTAGGRKAPSAGPRQKFDEDRRRRAAQRRAVLLAGPPSDADVARLLAEFQARGGRITECPPAHAAPVNNGAGRDALNWTT